MDKLKFFMLIGMLLLLTAVPSLAVDQGGVGDKPEAVAAPTVSTGSFRDPQIHRVQEMRKRTVTQEERDQAAARQKELRKKARSKAAKPDAAPPGNGKGGKK